MLKLDPKNTELLKQKQYILNTSIATTEEKLKQLQQIKEEADRKMAEGTEINQNAVIGNGAVDSSKITVVGSNLKIGANAIVEAGEMIEKNIESKGE